MTDKEFLKARETVEETHKNEKFLEIKKTVKELQDAYASDPRQKSFNALILGESGSGKSFLIRTARKPVHIDSFDPGGTKGLTPEIEKGEIVVDTRWEAEDPEQPFAFNKWKKVMKERIKTSYFDYFATYVLESATTWSEAIMNDILRKAKIPGEAPRWAHDYVPQKVAIRNWLRRCLDLPCDFILTGHLEGHKDDVSGKMAYRFMTTGKGVVTLPLLFDEIYVMAPKEGSGDKIIRRILTQATGEYVARSRLAKGGLLDTYEEADLKKILKKARMKTEDKPLFK